MRTETGKVILAMAVACLTAATASPQPAPHAETYRISGLVVNAVTGQPLSQVHVLYAPDDGSSKGIETTTGADGRFVFEPVPAGSWTLSAERRGFVRQKYGERSFYTTGAFR